MVYKFNQNFPVKCFNVLVFYKGYRTAKLALPSDMEAALKEKGLHCIMVDSNKKR